MYGQINLTGSSEGQVKLFYISLCIKNLPRRHADSSGYLGSNNNQNSKCCLNTIPSYLTMSWATVLQVWYKVWRGHCCCTKDRTSHRRRCHTWDWYAPCTHWSTLNWNGFYLKNKKEDSYCMPLAVVWSLTETKYFISWVYQIMHV